MENKLKLGIIGCGRIGIRHAEKSKEYFDTISVMDIDINAAKKLGKLEKCEYYTNIKSFLSSNKFDLVSICTPNGFHKEHTIEVLNYGFNVLVEKPMALSTRDAGEMISCSEKNNKRLFVVKQNRFNPPIKYLKNIIINNKLGKIYSYHLQCSWNRDKNYYNNTWKGSKKLDGGILYTQFSHFLDLLIYLLGDQTVLSCSKNNYNHNYIDIEDTLVAMVKDKNGSLGSINCTINSYNKNMEGSITIYAENGTIKVGGQYLNELEYFETNLPKPKLKKGNSANAYGTYTGSMSNHQEVYSNVFEVLIEGKQILTNSFDGWRTVKLIEDLYEYSK